MPEEGNRLALAALIAALSGSALAAPRKVQPRQSLPSELVIQTGHTLPVTAVALSADGSIAATAGRDGWAILWDARGRKLRAVQGDRLGLTAVALSADGTRLLTGGAGTAVLWDSTTGKALRRFGEPGEFLLAAWLSPDARTVTTIAQTGAVSWDAATGRRRVAYPVASKATAAALSRDGKSLAIAQGAEVDVWSTTAGVRSSELDAGAPVRAAAFLPDGGLATATEESLKVWNPARGLERASFKSPAAKTLLGLPDGRLVSAGGNTARLWDVRSDRPGPAFIGHLDSVGALAASADGRRLITGSDDHTARVWSASEPAKPPVVLGGAVLAPKLAAVSTDGKRLVIVDDRTARLWSLEDGSLVRASTGDWTLTTRFALTDDARLLACVRDRDMVDLRDLASGQDFGTFQWNLIKATSVGIDPRGRFLVTGYDQRVQVWNLPDGGQGPAVDPTPGRLATVLAALAGRRIVTVDDSGEVRFWSVDEGRWLGRAVLGGATVPGLVLSRDGRFLAAEAVVGGSRSIKVFDLESGQDLKSWQLDRDAAPLAFGSESSSLIALDEGGAWEWDIMTGRKLRAIELASPARIDWPQAADPRGSFLLAGGDGDVRLLSLRDGRELGRLVLSDRGWYVQSADGRLDGSPGLVRLTRGLSSGPLPATDKRFAPGLLAELAARARPR